jgi:dihydroorotase
VFEHVTTAVAVEFVKSQVEGLGATITPQHLLMNRNWLFQGGIRPHHYCLPVLKRERDRLALVQAVASGDARFFLGTDSAPHALHAKEAACGCAGIYSASAALELYAECFEAAGALHRLQGFASEHGARFYGLPLNEGTVTLERSEWSLPDSYPFGDGTLVPLRAGGRLGWRLRPAR